MHNYSRRHVLKAGLAWGLAGAGGALQAAGRPGHAASASGAASAAASPGKAGPAAQRAGSASGKAGNAAAAASTAGGKAGPVRQAVVDINTADMDVLLTLEGIDRARATAIVRGRPWASTADLVGKRILSGAAFDKLKARLTAS